MLKTICTCKQPFFAPIIYNTIMLYVRPFLSAEVMLLRNSNPRILNPTLRPNSFYGQRIIQTPDNKTTITRAAGKTQSYCLFLMIWRSNKGFLKECVCASHLVGLADDVTIFRDKPPMAIRMSLEKK